MMNSPQTRILMVEDDESLSSMLGEYLSAMDMRLSRAATAEAGLRALRGDRFDALILDVMLPDLDGFEVCRRVRSFSDIPILMLTARGDEMDRIVGLELGADDYLPKPFNPRELLARLRAILRRRVPPRAELPDDRLRFGQLQIDKGERVARIDGKSCSLTAHQFDLLLVLAQHAGRVMSREELMNRVRGESLEVFDRSIDVHISRIRAAIEADPKHPRRVITVRGSGYVFARHHDEDVVS